MQIVNGSKEIVVVDVADLTEAVTDLTGTSPTFTIRDAAGDDVVTDVAATASGMRVSCLVDTTVGTWVNGLHKFYVGFTVGSEVPLIYAGDFYII